jgi:aspartyl-tRNA(Asn)/glutamyl-tRNA(Gln) amidotransferase subunit B
MSSSSPPSELYCLCESAISDLPSEVAALRAGNKNVLNKIVGHVMRKSRGRADAVAVKALVEKIVGDLPQGQDENKSLSSI